MKLLLSIVFSLMILACLGTIHEILASKIRQGHVLAVMASAVSLLIVIVICFIIVLTHL